MMNPPAKTFIIKVLSNPEAELVIAEVFEVKLVPERFLFNVMNTLKDIKSVIPVMKAKSNHRN